MNKNRVCTITCDKCPGANICEDVSSGETAWKKVSTIKMMIN